MNRSLKKKFALVPGLVFVLQGGAFDVRGKDESYEHHPYHHYYGQGHWR